MEWWRAHGGVPQFSGTKIGLKSPGLHPDWNVHQVETVRAEDRILTERFGVIGWGGNSGFHAINLAVQFGASRIILVGYDMCLDHGVHWHGRHGGGLNNPTNLNVARWRRCIDGAAGFLEKIGVEVLNASPISALQNYRKVDFEEAINASR